MASSEVEMLEALVRVRDRLAPEEETAFLDMLYRLERGVQKRLSPKQAEWVERRYKYFELDAEEASENWVSSGKVAKTDVVFPYEKLPRPTLPPGRSK